MLRNQCICSTQVVCRSQRCSTKQWPLACLQVYAMFSLTNPMHSDVFPSVRKMEGEVVAMTAGMLGGAPLPGGSTFC